MGLPFALLAWSQSIVAVVVVVVVFVIGADCSGSRRRRPSWPTWPRPTSGARTWAPSAATAAIGFALSPLIGLQVRNSFGDDATWLMFAALGVVAAVLGGLALAGVGRRLRRDPSAVLET